MSKYLVLASMFLLLTAILVAGLYVFRSDLTGENGKIADAKQSMELETPDEPAQPPAVIANAQIHPLTKLRGRVVVGDMGVPLPGVRVIPLQVSGEVMPTDREGRFAFAVPVNSNIPLYTVRFVKDGYREADLVLAREEIEGEVSIERTIVMKRQGPTVQVTGVLTDERGRTLEGEAVNLFSEQQNARYSAESSEDGALDFGDVAAGKDYHLWVFPSGGYQDYTRQQLDLTAPDTDLQIILKAMAAADFEGRLVDDDGNGIANLQLQITSSAARSNPLEVVSGANGNFFVDDVPLGELTLRTLASPYILIEGITHTASSPGPVTIPVDLGDNELTGRVETADGLAVGAAEVTLLGARHRGTVASNVRWVTATDEFGDFRFNGLGNGPWGLAVDAPGYVRRALTVHSNESWLHIVVQRGE